MAVRNELRADVTVSGVGVPPGMPAIQVLKVGYASESHITAPSIGTMTVPYYFHGTVTISGAGIADGQPALKSLQVLGQLIDSTIQVGGLVGLFGAGLRYGGGFSGTLTAGGVGIFRVKGDLTAGLTLNGIGVPIGKPVLNSMLVTGSVLGSDIRVAGDVNRVQAAAFRDSTFFAGYNGPIDGSGDFDQVATVNLFLITGQVDAFHNSHVIASKFKNVSLRSIDADNDGTKFGFIADDSILKLVVGRPPIYVHTPGGPGIGPDFEVRIV
jgi:hypothetical protein